jgi:hypothetical protein
VGADGHDVDLAAVRTCHGREVRSLPRSCSGVARPSSRPRRRTSCGLDPCPVHLNLHDVRARSRSSPGAYCRIAGVISYRESLRTLGRIGRGMLRSKSAVLRSFRGLARQVRKSGRVRLRREARGRRGCEPAPTAAPDRPVERWSAARRSHRRGSRPRGSFTWGRVVAGVAADPRAGGDAGSAGRRRSDGYTCRRRGWRTPSVAAAAGAGGRRSSIRRLSSVQRGLSASSRGGDGLAHSALSTASNHSALQKACYATPNTPVAPATICG